MNHKIDSQAAWGRAVPISTHAPTMACLGHKPCGPFLRKKCMLSVSIYLYSCFEIYCLFIYNICYVYLYIKHTCMYLSTWLYIVCLQRFFLSYDIPSNFNFFSLLIFHFLL